jgi:hypothetical protein
LKGTDAGKPENKAGLKMTLPEPDSKKGPGSVLGRGERAGKPWLIAGVAGVILVIVFIAVTVNAGSHYPGFVSPNPAPVAGVSPTTGPPAITPAIVAPAPAKKTVDFILESTDPVSCGLTCRELAAAVTNSGASTAHNVCISLHLSNSRGDVIALNGADTLRKCIGDLDAGQKRSEAVTINADCGTFALKCVRETLILQTTVSSDETTVRFPDTRLAV